MHVYVYALRLDRGVPNVINDIMISIIITAVSSNDIIMCILSVIVIVTTAMVNNVLYVCVPLVYTNTQLAFTCQEPGNNNNNDNHKGDIYIYIVHICTYIDIHIIIIIIIIMIMISIIIII